MAEPRAGGKSEQADVDRDKAKRKTEKPHDLDERTALLREAVIDFAKSYMS